MNFIEKKFIIEGKERRIIMLEKFLGIFGFNTQESYIGLHRLNNSEDIVQPQVKPQAKDELKLSDLMRKS